MKQILFKKLVAGVPSLNSRQLRQLEYALELQKSINKTAFLLETSYDTLCCPHCGGTEKWRWGKRTKLQRYRCKHCKRTFNSLTGTPLAKLNKKEQWLKYAECMVKGMSLRRAAEVCQIDKNTAFHWRHRFLKTAHELKPTGLSGIIETRETYFRKSEKGSRKLKRKARERGGRHLCVPKRELVCLIIARDRYSNTYDRILNRMSTSEIKSIEPVFARDALFCSENKWVFKNFAKCFKLRHGTLNLKEGELVKKDIVHLWNVTKYRNRLRNWLLRFRGVATKYLPNYASWFRELDEYHMDISPDLLLVRAKTTEGHNYQPKIYTQRQCATKL